MPGREAYQPSMLPDNLLVLALFVLLIVFVIIFAK